MYTREERIKYWERQVMYLEIKLAEAIKKLEYLTSDKYQDWSERVTKEVKKNKQGA